MNTAQLHAPAGLVCHAGVSEQSLAPPGRWHFPSILVVEDDGVTAGLVSDMMTGGGYHIVGPVASVERALDEMVEGRIHAALINVELAAARNGFELARHLRTGRVPFAFITGAFITGQPAALTPDDLRDAPRLQKPFSRQEVLGVVHALLHAEAR